MIGDHTPLHTAVQWVPFVGILVLGLGYLAGTWRRGRFDASREAMELAVNETEILKGRASRFELELRESRERCSQDIAHLQGTVEQLREENAGLRSLVMGETVPPALASAIATAAATNLQALRDYLDERLHPVEQGIARLLTNGGGTE